MPQHRFSSPSSARNAALDRLRKATSRAGGRRSMHHKFAVQKVLQGSLLQKRDRDDQSPPSLREQMALNQLAQRTLRAVPSNIIDKRNAMRVYHKGFEMNFFFKEEDIEENSILGRGPGGQATNRRRQTCQIRHKPTGLMVRFSRFRSLYSNRKVARILLSFLIEQKIFGKFSRRGAEQMRQMARRRKRSRVRSKLLRMGQDQQEQHHHHQSSSSSISAASLAAARGRRFPVNVSYAAALAVDKNSALSSRELNRQCWERMNFITSLPEPKESSLAGGVREEEPEEDEGSRQIERLADLCEPPFSEKWWASLEAAWAKVECSSSADVCFYHPPSWFCLLFPVFPTSPLLLGAASDCSHEMNSGGSASSLPVGRVFIGPRDAWEGHERSYIKTHLQQQQQLSSSSTAATLRAAMRRPYINFFEMFGLRIAVSRSICSTNNNNNTTAITVISSISRDVGMNWIEGRTRLNQHPELTVLLWTHVVRSALEFCFDDVVKCVLDFLKDASETEKHGETRRVLQLVLQRLL